MRTQRGVVAVVAMWCIAVVVQLAIYGTVAYVAWHFLSKFW